MRDFGSPLEPFQIPDVRAGGGSDAGGRVIAAASEIRNPNPKIRNPDAETRNPNRRRGAHRRGLVPLERGSSRFESLILSHHSRRRVACECNERG